jgi:hypothetical protein
MRKLISVHQKKRGRGRPATGRDPAVTIRIPETVLAAANAWAKDQGIETRSETIVRLVEVGLAAPAAPGLAAPAPKRIRKEKPA